jgi:hypothetical protein
MSKEPIQQLREVHAIQGRIGCYDIDDYMLGLYNGLELALSLIERRDVKYKKREALAKVGLTMEDVKVIEDNAPSIQMAILMTEATLKDKNHGNS